MSNFLAVREDGWTGLQQLMLAVWEVVDDPFEKVLGVILLVLLSTYAARSLTNLPGPRKHQLGVSASVTGSFNRSRERVIRRSYEVIAWSVLAAAAHLLARIHIVPREGTTVVTYVGMAAIVCMVALLTGAVVRSVALYREKKKLKRKMRGMRVHHRYGYY